jgi:dTDP-4-dehydrorhamnose 3,5-epimerase
MFNVSDTSLPEVKKIKYEFFEDFRGRYVEAYNSELYKQFGLEFKQDNIVVSCKNSLRGIHGDDKTWKLMTCLQGRIYLVVVDCRRESKTFGKWEGFTLTGTNGIQILVPARFGVAPFWLTDEAVFYYKQSTLYGEASQFTFRWNEPVFNIKWPMYEPILSTRDSGASLIC